ncbi:MAG: glycosyl transferase [Fluviicola sp.]|nr:MAG: glycosyl transferase [Fluviicola sp.]
MNHKLSATIITFNEERNINRCIESLLPIADEIIVLDSFSTDKTEEICTKNGVRFEKREWKGYSNAKNYLNSLANHDYIFSIDADEAPDKKLQESILKVKKQGFEGAYAVNRLTNYCGKWVKHSGWYPDVKTRIFPKKTSKWEGKFVHEKLIIDGSPPSHLLEGHLLHYSYYNYTEHRERADKYSKLTAQKLYAKGKRATAVKPFISGLGRFISMYFIKKGFLDGRAGWKIATISAKSNIYKYKELRRLQHEAN